ncbi:MAG: helix-turn-helix domain-containing protein, partial [Chryseobacterium sp.]
DYAKALDCYRRAKEILDRMPDNFLKGLVYNGLAKVYIGMHDWKWAQQYLTKAENISEQSNHLNLKNEIYNTSLQYYLAIKDIEKFEEVTAKKDSAVEKIVKNNTAFINKEFSELEKKNTVTEKKNLRKTSYIFIIAAFSVIVWITMIIRKKQHNQKLKITKERFDDVHQRYSELKGQIEVKEIAEAEPTGITVYNSAQQPMMPAATEQNILAKLEKFEKTTLYTRNTISLPYLATYCGTNTKYLSYVINNFKQKDFNNYINELRINYIIAKIRSEPKYLKYKVASLAEEAGFSSQSKFANAFKKVIDISPSQFIHNQKSM